MPDTIQAIPDLCEVTRYRAGDPSSPWLLIELPHGATLHAHFDHVRKRLRGTLPEKLEEFFFVNTDVGTPECADQIGRSLAELGFSTLILRSLIPRTLVDCNRTVDGKPDYAKSGITAAIPDYVKDDDDRMLLAELHRVYHSRVEQAYREICEPSDERIAGLAIQLHSYAPKSVRIDNIDDGIVAALRKAYEPEQYAKWDDRPEVDLITETDEGAHAAPRDLVSKVVKNYATIGIEATENRSYRLHPDTWGYIYAQRYRNRVLCVELNRGLLATPFTPFSQMTIGTEESARLARPIAEATATFFES